MNESQRYTAFTMLGILAMMGITLLFALVCIYIESKVPQKTQECVPCCEKHVDLRPVDRE